MEIESFLEYLIAVKGYSSETVKAYRTDLVLITDRLREQGVTLLAQVNQRTVVDLITWMKSSSNGRHGGPGLSDATIARRLAALSSYMYYMQSTTDPSLQNPIKCLPHRWKKNREPKPVDDMVLDLLLASIDNLRDKALLHLALASGLRLSELHQLNMSSISIQVEADQTGKVNFIGVGKVLGKGRKMRPFYVTGYAVDVLSDYIATRTDSNPALFLSERRQRLSKRAMEYTLAAWCKKLGFSHINIHRLRHSYATRLANANIDSMVLKELMGHSSFTTTQQYFKLTDKTLARGYFAAMEYVSKSYDNPYPEYEHADLIPKDTNEEES